MLKDKSENQRFKMAVLALLVLCAFLCTGTFFSKYIGKKSKDYKGQQFKAKYEKASVNVLLVGLDVGDPENPKNTKVKRTDTIMMVKYDSQKQSVIVTSIPRDILVKVSGKNYKINDLYAIKGESYLKDTVEKLVEQPIDYVVKIDYKGFKKVVDAIGGIQLDIDRNMKYDDSVQNLHIDLKKGKNVKLDGDKAEQFFRWRKNNDGSGLEDGDIGRINNQHKFIEAVISKCKSPKILLSMPKVLNALPESVSTDMPLDKMIGYGLKMLDLKKENIKTITLMGTPVEYGGISYLRFDADENANIISVINGEAPEEILNIKRGDLKIKILNGTKINGMAASLSKKLMRKGYKNIEVGNTTLTKETEIKVKDDKLKYIITNDSKISKVSENKVNDTEKDAVIILGQDYKK